MSERPAFLNVAQSLSGRRWIGPTADRDRDAERLGQTAQVSHALARILARNGVAPDLSLIHI